MSKEDTLNVLFSSDDHYAQHLAAAIYSLLNHNGSFKRVSIYIIDNEISSKSRDRLVQVVDEFDNACIEFLDFAKWRSKLKLNLAWKISIAAYARLFVGELLPSNVERVIYLDCDMIICSSLYLLWNYDLKQNIVGAVQDLVSMSTKSCVGVEKNEAYFNSGLLLIDLSKWRERNIGEDCVFFIEEKKGMVGHHDQGVLNGVFRNHWTRLPLKYNVMTINYFFSYHQMQNYYGDLSGFYTLEEISRSKAQPAILHFTPSFTSRPWFSNCCHPLKEKYWESLSHTPWKDATPQKDTSKWYVRLQGWRYRHLPV